jgi:N-acylethanolamine-hydrolysing acid amidase
MKSLILSLLCLGLTLSGSAVSKFMGKNSNGIPMYSIDLDSPPETRFSAVSADFKAEVNIVINNYLSQIPWFLLPVVTEVAGALWWLQPEYYQELVGMGSSLGLDPKSLMVAQYAYEFSAFCTSVIAHDASGQIIHSRNLDFAFASTMRNITYEAVFTRND